VTHQITGYVCDAPAVSFNTPHVGICAGTEVFISILDTSGTPTTEIRSGSALTTNGSNFVSGILETKTKYDSQSEATIGSSGNRPVDEDNMTLEACVDANTHTVCRPFEGQSP